jgi:predicted unusual protein kinase regulating ubiquinone biosynthesis (AarF/ABC1/UbiB family)
MVGDISPPMRDNIRKVFLGVVRRNYDDVVTALMKLGFVPASADRGLLKRALSWAVDTFYEMSFAELRSVNPQVVLDRLQEVFYTESVRIPANFAFLGRALGTLSGLCTALDPSFQFVTVAEPFARRLVGARRRDVVRQAVEEVRDIAISSYATLRLTQSVLAQVDSGELSVERHLSDISRSVTRLERAASRIIYGLLVTAFLTVGALIYRSHYTLFALGAFVVALIFLVNIFVSLRRSRRTF